MKGMTQRELVEYLVKNKCIKRIRGVYYPTDKLANAILPEDNGREALKKFCEDCDIPYQVPAPGGGKYTVKYITEGIAKKYLRTLKEVDRADLVRVTRQYYRETTHPKTIKNYFEDKIWEIALEDKNWGGSSGNFFED